MRDGQQCIADALRRLADIGERMFPDDTTLSQSRRWRWEVFPSGIGRLTAIIDDANFEPPENLLGLEAHIAEFSANLRRFLRGRPFNHMLLTGPRGCGKSSLARGVIGRLKKCRLIETDARGLSRLHDLRLAIRRLDKKTGGQKYIVFCDDLSLDGAVDRALFSRLKNALDDMREGGEFCAIATSNRRRLLPQHYRDNLPADGEISPNETAEEETALSDRFGLWLPFYAPDGDEYRSLARHWLTRHRIRATDALLNEAAAWADMRGSRSGRIAKQFAVAVSARRR